MKVLKETESLQPISSQGLYAATKYYLHKICFLPKAK